MFRSGSTLTEQVLAGHSRVAAGGEIGFLPSMVRTALAPFPAAMARATRQQLDLLGARYLEMLSGLFPGAEHVIDKRPDNFLYIGLIKTLFPNARIIHTTRDPLDNCLSIFFLHLDHSMGYALDLMDTGHYYAQYRRLMAHWKALYGADILDFDYDALVREPRPAVERLLAFCGLGVGGTLHVVPARGECRQDGERLAGPRAALSAVLGTLATLCGAACAVTPLSARSHPRRRSPVEISAS